MNDHRTSLRRIFLGLLGWLAFVVGDAATSAADEPQPIPAVDDADAKIRAHMGDHWRKPERLRWRIAYHPIKGLTAQSAWHIEGTHWWVRVNPGWVKLDEFDKTLVYELDAVALDQNYGTIDFYVYHREKVK